MAKKGKKDIKSEFGQYKDEESRQKAFEEARKKEMEKIQIEEDNSRLNLLKIVNRWREIMKITKSKTLKKDLETLKQVQARRIDQKNACIMNLKKDLSESNQQFGNALQHHLINIDTLIEFQDSRISSINEQFEADLSMLENEFNNERIKIQAKHAKERSDILGIMARAEHEFMESESDAKHEYSSVKDDVKNKNLEEKHALRIQLEGAVEDLWRQFQSALNNYNSTTEERKKQFEELKTKDQKNAREVEHQMKKLVKLQENIAHLKSKMNSNAKEYEEKNLVLKEQKDKIQSQFLSLKKKMNSFRDDERERLTKLTILSNSVIKKLSVKVEKAEMIIKLAEMNKKLETEEERVIPFYDESELEKIEELKIDIELPKEFDGMQQFSKRYNKVFLDKLALDKKHELILDENNRLRSILKQYLDGITLSEDVLGQLNPLIVVNGKTNAPLRNRGVVHIPYVEASQAYPVLG